MNITKNGVLNNLSRISVGDPMYLTEGGLGAYLSSALPEGEYNYAFYADDDSAESAFPRTKVTLLIFRKLAGLDDYPLLRIDGDGYKHHHKILTETTHDIVVDTARIYIGNGTTKLNEYGDLDDDYCISTGGDGMYGPVVEYNVEEETLVLLPDGKQHIVPAGFFGIALMLDFDDGSLAEDAYRSFALGFGFEDVPPPAPKRISQFGHYSGAFAEGDVDDEDLPF